MKQREKNVSKNAIDYSAIARSEKFKQLTGQKKRFIIPITIFFSIFYFTLPLLTSYSDVLNKSFSGAITWVWVVAFSQFIMTWTLCMMYAKKAKEFDKLSDEIVATCERGEQL